MHDPSETPKKSSVQKVSGGKVSGGKVSTAISMAPEDVRAVAKPRGLMRDLKAFKDAKIAVRCGACWLGLALD